MAKRPLSTEKQLTSLISSLKKKFGYVSVNYHEDTGCNVGFWTVPADAKSAALLRGDSSEGTAYVRLCNSPIFKGFVWGSLIKVETRGEIRAYFTLGMQKGNKAITADQAYLKKFIEDREKKRLELVAQGKARVAARGK